MRAATYEEINEILIPWSEKYGLHIYTRVKENIDVRSIAITDDSGVGCQLWDNPVRNKKPRSALPNQENPIA
jgi:hypothetical protein